MTYSSDIRKRVLQHIENGGTRASAADRFQVSARTIYYWQNQPADAPKKSSARTSWKFDRTKLVELVQDNPEALQKDFAEMLGVSVNTISYTLKKLGFIRKKKRYMLPKKLKDMKLIQ